MSSNKSHQAVIAERRERVAALYLRQRTQREIAAQVGCSLNTVCLDLKAIQMAWQASAVANLDERKAMELARIDRLEREYWEAWGRSRRNAERRTAKQVQGEHARSEASKTEEGRDGDPRFLAGVQWCIEQRCKVLGILAPTKVAPTTPDGEKSYDGDPRAIASAILARLGLSAAVPSGNGHAHANGSGTSAQPRDGFHPRADDAGPLAEGPPPLEL